MFFLGFESKEEKRKKVEEQARREKAINTLPIYFTSAVDFDYKILHGGLYSWVTGEGDFNEKHESTLRGLRESAYNCGADCLIDMKFNITTSAYGRPFYVVHATGVAVKRIE